MVEAIFGGLTDIVTSVITWFTSMFTSISAIFYDTATSELTLLGTLVLIGVGVGAFYFVLRWIINLIQIRTKG